MIKKYKERPVVIEAIHLTERNIYQTAAWCKAQVIADGTMLAFEKQRNGRQATAGTGDYIVKNNRGTFYPMSASQFNATYEVVE